MSTEVTLRSFCKFCGPIELREVTRDHVTSFSNNPVCAQATRLSRFSGVKCFVQHFVAREEMPAIELTKPLRLRTSRTPFIYTRAQIAQLLKATARCQEKATELDSRTFRMFLLLLYVTGATVQEVLSLRWSSVDLRRKLISFGGEGSTSHRSIPVGKDLVSELMRHRRCVKQDRHAFFLQHPAGGPIKRKNLQERFERLRAVTNLGKGLGGHSPRLQDLRFTFAVHRLNACLQRGEDLNRLIPALSTYMGYRSLTAAEQFLAFVPSRFKHDLERLSPGKHRKQWSQNVELIAFLNAL